MKYLFVHQNFSGAVPAFRQASATGSRQRGGVSSPSRTRNGLEGVRRVNYQAPVVKRQSVHPHIFEYASAAARGAVVAQVAQNVRQLGFTPDIIIGHHGWGEMLNIVDVWPGVPVLGYFELYYTTSGQDVGFDPEFPTDPSNFPRIRAMNVVNLLGLALNQHGQSPTQWQRGCYPDWAQKTDPTASRRCAAGSLPAGPGGADKGAGYQRLQDPAE